MSVHESREMGQVTYYILGLPQVRYNCTKFHHWRACVTDFRDGYLFATGPQTVSIAGRSVLNMVNFQSHKSYLLNFIQLKFQLFTLKYLHFDLFYLLKEDLPYYKSILFLGFRAIYGRIQFLCKQLLFIFNDFFCGSNFQLLLCFKQFLLFKNYRNLICSEVNIPI